MTPFLVPFPEAAMPGGPTAERASALGPVPRHKRAYAVE